MPARPTTFLLVTAFALIAASSAILAEDTSRDLRDRALADLRTQRDQATEPPVLPHLRNAVAFLERSLDQFPDADHVLDPPQAIDNLRQAIDSATVAAKEALRAGNGALADALKADCATMAQAARRLATMLLGEAQSQSWLIDSESAQQNAAAIQTAQDEIARGDEQLRQQDASFRPTEWFRYDNATNRFKAAWIAAQGADGFRLRLLAASVSPRVFSPNGDGRREEAVLSVDLEVNTPPAGARVRGVWSLRSPSGAAVRTVLEERDAPQGVSFSMTLPWNGRDDAGEPAPDGRYDWGFTAVLLPPGGPENPLAGSLTGDVTLDATGPTFGAPRPAEGVAIAEHRPEIGVSFSDALSGVDAASATIIVEGVDSQAARTAEGISFTPAEAFTDGEVTVVVTVRDLAENEAGRSWSFHVVSAIVRVDPVTGGTATVDDPASPIFGASIEIPPGAVTGASTVTVTFVPDPLRLPEGEAVGAGPAIEIASSTGNFIADVLIRIPYDESIFAAAGLGEEAATLFVLEEGSSEWIEVEIDSIDTDANVVIARRRSLSVFRVGYLVADPDATTVDLSPETMAVDDDPAPEAQVLVTPRTTSGVLVGRGHNVSLAIVNGAGVLSAVTDLMNGTWRADLNAPTRPGTARIEATVDGRTMNRHPLATYMPAPVAVLALEGLPAAATAGDAIPFEVVARDRFGNVATAYGGVVQFVVSDPAATLNGQDPATFTIDFPDDGSLQGRATATLVLFTAGVQSLTARDGADVEVSGAATVLVRPSALSRLEIVQGDGQTGAPSVRLAEPLRALARDGFGNGVPGRDVEVRIASGGGLIQRNASSAPEPGPVTMVTDAQGVVEVIWVLGPVVGPQTLEMQVVGTAFTVTFAATASAAAPPDSLRIAGGGSVEVGGDFPLTLFLVIGGQGAAGLPDRIALVSDRGIVDAFAPLFDAGGGEYRTGVRSDVGGTATVHAEYDDPGTPQAPDLTSNPVTVTFLTVSEMTVAPTAQTVRVDQAPVYNIFLRDSAGNGVPGQERVLVVESSRNVAGGLTVDDISAVAEVATGQYQFSVRSSATGTATLTVTYEPGGVPPATATVTFDPLPPPGPGDPRVVETSPTNGAAGVPEDASIAIVFDRVMNVSNLDLNRFQVFRQGTEFASLVWRRVPWLAYNEANGETRPALGDIDGDGRDELVVGLGPFPGANRGGWFVAFDDDQDPSASVSLPVLRWFRIPWQAYNESNGETRPSCGDIDGDGRAEIVVGLGGKHTGTTSGGGFVAVFDDLVAGGGFLRWRLAGWSAYNTAVGATRPAAGDIDGDGKAELVVGFDAYPQAGGWMQVIDDLTTGLAHVRWLRLDWSGYNSRWGETRPALGDTDGDLRAELAIGVGRDRYARGWTQIKDDLLSNPAMATLKWVRLRGAYALRDYAETWPAWGDVDADGRDELVVGTGPFPGDGSTGGWLEVFHDADPLDPAAAYKFAQEGRFQLNWLGYNKGVGETRPACGDISGDGADEVVLGLGSFPQAGGWLQVRGGEGNIAGTVAFTVDASTGVTRTVATFRPERFLGLGTTYTVTVQAIRDLEGALVVPWTSTFATRGVDGSPPRVRDVAPAPGATNVATTAEVLVSLYEPIQAPSNLADVMTVTGPGGEVVGQVTLVQENAAALFRPAATLTQGTVYTVRVPRAGKTLRDLAGNEFDQDPATGVKDAFVSTSRTADTTAPAATTGLTATLGQGTVVLSWTANVEVDLRGYRAYAAPTPAGPFARISGEALLGDPSFVDTQAAQFTQRSYRVTAIDTSGNESAPSTTVTQAMPDGLLRVSDFNPEGEPALPLLAPFVARTIGSGAVLAGALVRYRVTQGAGRFPGNLGAVDVRSNADGDAVSPLLQFAGGLHFVEASLPGWSVAPVLFRVTNNEPPSLLIRAPRDGDLHPVGAATLVGNAIDTNLVDVRVNGAVVPTRGDDGYFETSVPILAGPNTIDIVASDVFGRSSQRTLRVTGDGQGPVLTVTFPVEGQQVEADEIAVTGMVNDQEAVVIADRSSARPAPDGSFILEGIHVAPGQNEVRVVAVDRAGNVSNVVVRRFSSPQATNVLDLDASPVSGAAPFVTTLTARYSGAEAASLYHFDVDGDGRFEVQQAASSGPFTFTQSGTYSSTVVVETIRGSFFSASTTVTVVPAARQVAWNDVIQPVDVAVDDVQSKVVILGSGPASVYTLDLNLTNRESFALSGTASPTGFAMAGLSTPVPTLYVTDDSRDSVFKFNRTKVGYEPDPAFGTMGEAGGPGLLADPTDAVVAGDSLYVVDNGNDRIVVLDARTGALQNTFGRRGSGPGEMAGPRGIAVDAAPQLWVVDTGNRRLVRFAPDGTFLGVVDLPWSATPIRVELSPRTGELYVLDRGRLGIGVVALTGRLLREESALGLVQPTGLAVSPEAQATLVFFSDDALNRILKVEFPEEDPAESPEAVWERFKAALAARDTGGALALIVEERRAVFDELLREWDDVAKIPPHLGALTPAERTKGAAFYTVPDPFVPGETFIVKFRRTRDGWRIVDF